MAKEWMTAGSSPRNMGSALSIARNHCWTFGCFKEIKDKRICFHLLPLLRKIETLLRLHPSRAMQVHDVKEICQLRHQCHNQAQSNHTHNEAEKDFSDANRTVWHERESKKRIKRPIKSIQILGAKRLVEQHERSGKIGTAESNSKRVSEIKATCNRANNVNKQSKTSKALNVWIVQNPLFVVSVPTFLEKKTNTTWKNQKRSKPRFWPNLDSLRKNMQSTIQSENVNQLQKSGEIASSRSVRCPDKQIKRDTGSNVNHEPSPSISENQCLSVSHQIITKKKKKTPNQLFFFFYFLLSFPPYVCGVCATKNNKKTSRINSVSTT